MDVILKIELTDERMVEIGLYFKELIEEIEAKDKLEFTELRQHNFCVYYDVFFK